MAETTPSLLTLPPDLLSIIFSFVCWNPILPQMAFGLLCTCRTLTRALRAHRGGGPSDVGEMRLWWARSKALCVALSKRNRFVSRAKVSSLEMLFTVIDKNAADHVATITRLLERVPLRRLDCIRLGRLSLDRSASMALLTAIAKSDTPNLTWVSLGSTKMGDAAVPFCSHLLQTVKHRQRPLAAVKYLNLCNTEFPSEAAVILGHALAQGALPGLAYIGLSSNSIGINGALAVLRGILTPRVFRMGCGKIVLSKIGIEAGDAPALAAAFDESLTCLPRLSLLLVDDIVAAESVLRRSASRRDTQVRGSEELQRQLDEENGVA